ncbi:hypothetical protein Tsubulata_039079 [Turnera subulata]|uniref:HSF-type DNA-binding domain-containing protein n=1 Tax=Turnera subulata TaxID=218843 RepID=A0A9Q0FIN9_9ROSI|nr:hypothetical protein Tsubulata_039079 [Turnera subulata]
MVRSTDGETLGVAPFLKKCYEMVDDQSTDSIISWGPANDSFIIWDMTEFSVQLLPKYFKHSNASSFIRQLNIYGFRKIDTDNWEFANDGFIRGQKHLMKNIIRRKNLHGAENRKLLQQQGDTAEHSDNVENGLWKEVENLKTDKNAVMQELVKLKQHQETADNKLILLRDRMQGMEKNQQQMLSFLVMAMQSPGFLVQLLPKKENNWRMAEPGSIIEQADDTEPLSSDAMIVRYQPPVDQVPELVHSSPLASESQQETNPYSDGMKDFFLNSDFVKLLMDENISPLENPSPFFLPELGDDGAWEQLLLASPFSENIEDTEKDGEEPTGAGTEMEITGPGNGTEFDESQNFEFVKEMEKSQNTEKKSANVQVYGERSQNVEVLTKQMGLLASETKHKNDAH